MTFTWSVLASFGLFLLAGQAYVGDISQKIIQNTVVNERQNNRIEDIELALLLSGSKNRIAALEEREAEWQFRLQADPTNEWIKSEISKIQRELRHELSILECLRKTRDKVACVQ